MVGPRSTNCLAQGRPGTSVKWIGARYTIVAGGVRVAIDSDRIAKLAALVQDGLKATGLIKNVRSMAGELLTIRPFVNMLRAAVYAMDTQNSVERGRNRPRVRPDGSVFAKAVQLLFACLAKFLAGQHGGLQRVRLLSDRWTVPRWTIRADASTTGFGGILLDARGRPNVGGQPRCPRPCCAHTWSRLLRPSGQRS